MVDRTFSDWQKSPRYLAALELAAQGWHVLRINPGLKTPPAGSHAWRDATRNPDMIDQWWSEGDYNVAVCPGLSGHMLADLDDKGNGASTWLKLTSEHDDLSWMETRATRTPNGIHYWFKGEAPPKVGEIGPGIDTRGQGSYALVPPSIVDGKEYEWINAGPAVEMPKWLAEKIVLHQEAPRMASVHEMDLDINVERAKLFIRDAVASGNIGRPGNRDNMTFWMCCSLRDLGISPDRGIDMLKELWLPYCVDLLGEKQDLIEWKMKEAGKRANQDGCEAIDPAWSSWFEDTPEVFDAAIPPDQKARVFRIARMSELLQLPRVEFWDSERMIPRYDDGAVGMIFGPPNHHKTNVLISKVWDLLLQPNGPKILYATGEGRQGLGVRMRAHGESRGVTDWSLFEARFGEIAVPLIEDPQDVGAWTPLVVAEAPQIVIIDTFSTMLAGMIDEDVKGAALLTDRGKIGKLAHELRAYLWIVHHTGWNPDHERGSSGFRGNVSATNQCTANKPNSATHVDLHCVRMKDGSDGHHTYYSIQYVGGVPVPVKCEPMEWEFHKEKNKDWRVILQGALQNLEAHTIETAKDALAIARKLYGNTPPRGMGDEAFGQALVRTARQIDRLEEASEFRVPVPNGSIQTYFAQEKVAPAEPEPPKRGRGARKV